MTASSTLFFRIRAGLSHRLICAAPGMGMIWLVLALAGPVHAAGEWPFVVQGVILTFLGFVSPLILTRGMNKPIPSSRHLALITPKAQRVLFWVGMGVVIIPSTLRVLQRLL